MIALASSLVEINSPDKATEPKERGVSIFCYNIQEHPISKNQKPIITKNEVYFPPMVVNLHYLITINSSNESEIPEIRQKILRLLYDTPILSGSLLVDELRKNDTGNGFLEHNDNTELKIRLNPLSIEELNQLWTLFPGTKYRPSMSYIISPVVIPSTQKMPVSIVKSKTIQLNEGI